MKSRQTNSPYMDNMINAAVEGDQDAKAYLESAVFIHPSENKKDLRLPYTYQIITDENEKLKRRQHIDEVLATTPGIRTKGKPDDISVIVAIIK